jgi:hypothetical protein
MHWLCSSANLRAGLEGILKKSHSDNTPSHGGGWTIADDAARRLLRALFLFCLVLSVGLVVHASLYLISNDDLKAFRTLFYVFIALYFLFSLFSFVCFVTKFKQHKILPEDPLPSNRIERGIYRTLWGIERFLGIIEFTVEQRYAYWTFTHYMFAVIMFLNATYCLSWAELFLRGSRFHQLSFFDNIRYMFDLVHKGIILSEWAYFFDKHWSHLPHVFEIGDPASLYFFSFKVVSAISHISLFAMIVEPALTRARVGSSKGRRLRS